MRKIYSVRVTYKTKQRRVLAKPKFDTDWHFLGYFYGEEDEVRAKTESMTDKKTLWSSDFYDKEVIERTLDIREINDSDYITFASLQESLPHTDFIRYCKDNQIFTAIGKSNE